jgi:hypothetical protein
MFLLFLFLQTSVVDPDPGSGAFLTPGSGMGKKSGSGSGMNNQDHISWSLETMFWVYFPSPSLHILAIGLLGEAKCHQSVGTRHKKML